MSELEGCCGSVTVCCYCVVRQITERWKPLPSNGSYIYLWTLVWVCMYVTVSCKAQSRTISKCKKFNKPDYQTKHSPRSLNHVTIFWGNTDGRRASWSEESLDSGTFSVTGQIMLHTPEVTSNCKPTRTVSSVSIGRHHPTICRHHGNTACYWGEKLRPLRDL
jgi:hypothetical protein